MLLAFDILPSLDLDGLLLRNLHIHFLHSLSGFFLCSDFGFIICVSLIVRELIALKYCIDWYVIFGLTSQAHPVGLLLFLANRLFIDLSFEGLVLRIGLQLRKPTLALVPDTIA